MIDDFAPMGRQSMPPGRKKPKIVHPLPKPDRPPLPKFEELDDNEPPARVGATENSPTREEEFPGITTDPAPDNTPAPLTPATHLISAPEKRKWYQRSWHLSRIQLLLAGGGALIVVGALSSFIYYVHAAPPLPPLPSYHHVSPKPKPATTVPSTLTGLPVDPSVNKRPVTAVMIENSLDARPQSGLDQAGVVFEAIAEGGITRFMALYQDTQPSYVGPVRSSRPYYVEWALGFDAGYAHVGGSPEALQDIKTWHVRDLDQFYNSGAYWRTTSRYAPHNVYTTIAKLQALQKAKGYTSSTYTGFVRKPPVSHKNSKSTPKVNQPALPGATSIDLAFSGPYYNVHYTYDAQKQVYKRFEAGQPHMEVDAQGHQVQITPKVVLALVMPYRLESDGYHSYYNTIGSGPLYVFQDGTVQKGTWTKTSRTSQFSFTDAAGKPIALEPGQTWVSALASTSDVGYKP